MSDEGQFNIWLDIKNSNKKKKNTVKRPKCLQKPKKNKDFALWGFLVFYKDFFVIIKSVYEQLGLLIKKWNKKK